MRLGCSIEEVAALTGMAESSVRTIARSFCQRGPGRSISAATRARVAVLHRGGLTVEQIAEALSLKAETVALAIAAAK